MIAFLQRHLFLSLLAISLVVGFVFSSPLSGLANSPWLKWVVVSTTMFAMAWPLKFYAIRTTLARPWAPLFATAVNFLMVPLIALPFAGLLSDELRVGLLVACCVPTTLATGPVWTRRAGGDDNVALLVTIITNSICFLVTPALVFWLTGNDLPQELLGDTIQKLLFSVVVPISLAQLIRLERRSAEWATNHKKNLGKLAQAGVLVMALLGAVQAGLRMPAGIGAYFDVNQLALMVVVVVIVHTSAFVVAFQLAKLLGFSPGEQIAIAVSGSQKTMMIGLGTAINLGVSILPIVTYHAFQLIIDTFFVDRHRAKNPPSD